MPSAAAHVVLPAIGEVVFVQEPLADAQAKIGQAYLSGTVTEAGAARVANAVLKPVSDTRWPRSNVAI